MIDLRIDLNLFSGMNISPFITYILKSKKQQNFTIGLIQKMIFFKKTFGEIKLSIPVFSQYNEKYSIYAKACFLF